MRVHILLLACLLAFGAGCEQQSEDPAGGSAAGTNGVTPGTTGPWKVASAFSSTLPSLGPIGKRVTERLKKLSGGRLEWQVFDPGTLVAPLEVLDAVGQATVDAGLSLPSSWYDRMPAVSFFASPPFGADTVEYLAWLYEGGGLSEWRALYEPLNVVPLPCGYMPPEAAGWFRTELSGGTPFKGQKVHLYGLGGQVLQKLGAQVLLLAAEDLYPALERGVLDGAQVSIPSIDDKMGLAKVAKHYYFPGWHQQASAVELLINKGRWDGLSETDRLLVEVVCRDALVAGIASAESEQSQALADLRKQGAQIHVWSEQQLQVFRNAYDEVLKEMRIKDATFKGVHDAYTGFRQTYAQWSNLSRLPRGF